MFDKAPFLSCHAATLTETTSGDLLCAYFAGTEEGHDDVRIWISRYSKETWGSPESLPHCQSIPHWNPVLFTFPSGEIALFYKVGRAPYSWSGVLQRSLDNGASWEGEVPLPAGIVGPAKNRPILSEGGTLLAGSSVESWHRWGCFVESSWDGGISWEKSRPINVPNHLFGIIQPALVPLGNGEILLLARSHGLGRICTARSYDEGKTWSAAAPSALLNPNAAIDAIRLQEGPCILV